jgi:hypothetical protein
MNFKILLILFLFVNLSYAKINEFSQGDVIDADKINENFNHDKEINPGYGHASIGMILPFHKSAGSGLSIPEGWASCDGSQVSVEQNGPLDPDGDGLYTLPNLNNQVYSSGRGKYLRGGTTSGMHNHSTARTDNNNVYKYYSGGYYGGNVMGTYRDVETSTARSSYTGSHQSKDNYRIQVTAMTVVYIMRIK